MRLKNTQIYEKKLFKNPLVVNHGLENAGTAAILVASQLWSAANV